MIFGFWKKQPLRSQQTGVPRPRSTARFGGMQVREIQARLELLVDPVLTRHRSVIEPAKALAEYSLVEQERFIASVDRISLNSPELAFNFCEKAIPALAELDDAAWEPWVDGLTETLRDRGLDACIADIEAFRSYQAARTPASGSVAFTDITRVLDSYIQALNGRALKLSTAEQSYTDTETLFLPAHISRFPTREENFRLYKALLVHQWAQTRFGTWRIDVAESIREFPDPERALRIFHRLETLRLDACLGRELPGMAHEMATLRVTSQPIHPRWQDARTELQKTDADARTSLAWLAQLYLLDFEPEAVLYQGQLRAEKAADVISERGRRGREAMQEILSRLPQAMSDQSNSSAGKPDDGQTGLNMLQESDGAAADDTLDTHDFSYDEWDHARQRYRKNWCLLHEQSITPVHGVFVDDTLSKYRGMLKQLRRSFEALRQEDLRLRREPFGDDIDIDAGVEAWSDIHNGLEASENLFIQTRRQERHVAVMFMIDMSASTAGWINRVERESLVLLCEALEILGDRYAIYGFSGRGNRHCQSFHIKDFDEQYNDEVRHRIEGIQPQDYTRLGAAIRHFGARLNRVEARTRLLITLSDGRPDDVDGYRGHYGIEDTRKALIEARHSGIHPFCITIDHTALDYLPHMFGRNNFAVINQVDKLPYRIGDIYRRLTT